jgi:SAM-dependent methyltransferase
MKWYENDDFWHTMAGRLFNDQRVDQGEEETDKILNHIDPPDNGRILDLCCGPGRHSLALARRGYRVTGVDRTREYLDRAEKSAAKEHLNVEFVHNDMREFCRENTYDAALNVFTSFGYFEDQNDDLKVLKNLAVSLKPGGRLIMDMIGKEVLARMFRPRDWYTIDSVTYLEERKLERHWSWIQNKWIRCDGATRQEFILSHRLYSAAELSSLLEQAGFQEIHFYGDYDGSAYDHQAQRLVAVAIKHAGDYSSCPNVL